MQQTMQTGCITQVIAWTSAEIKTNTDSLKPRYYINQILSIISHIEISQTEVNLHKLHTTAKHNVETTIIRRRMWII